MAEVMVIPVMSLYEGSKTIIKIYSDWSEVLRYIADLYYCLLFLWLLMQSLNWQRKVGYVISLY